VQKQRRLLDESLEVPVGPACIGCCADRLLLPAEEAEWKQYKTSDSETDVLNWYENTLPDYGWVAASGEDLGDVEMEGGLIFVNQNDPEVMLVVFVAPDLEGGGEISILIGRIRISVDEE
jgi:hypothetical protein